VFGEDAEGSVQFHEATHLTASDWDQLQHTVRHRVLRYFHRTFNWPRLTCPARARRHADPWSRKISATSNVDMSAAQAGASAS